MTQTNSIEPKTLDSLKAIIRRDLNLGADEPIADDMPLVGGDMDLDSLDVLMLVTSIEKQYGIKITSDQSGKEMFESVTTLATFIDRHAAGQAQAGPEIGDRSSVDLSAALNALPHRPPFRFVSELTELVPGERGVGQWRVAGDEDFFAGHFPGQPIVPGVLISEALAQVSGIVFASSRPGANEGRLAGVDVRFRGSVSPPATIILESKLSTSHGDLHVFEVVARSADQIVAEGTVTLYQAAGPNPSE